MTEAPPRVRPTARDALPRFLAVGLVGVGVNELVVYLLHGRAGVPLLLSGAVATEIAIIGNYTGNELFTFHLRRLHLGRLLRFNAIALGGLALTVGTLWVLQHVAELHYLIDNLIAIGAGSGWNFLWNFGWTWGHRAGHGRGGSLAETADTAEADDGKRREGERRPEEAHPPDGAHQSADQHGEPAP